VARVRPHRSDQEFAAVGDQSEVPLATYAGRLGARLLDFGFLTLLAYGPYAFLVEGGVLGLIVLVLVLQMIYDVILTVSGGATPGKRIAGIRVVRADTGQPPGLGAVVLRTLVLNVLTWVITGLSAVLDEKRHRGLHDRAARTIVVAV
jgi:uncharacterized RDD family membrane protein YckC